MTLRSASSIRSLVRLGFTLGLIAALAACASKQLRLPAPGEQNADKFLFDRGTESLTAHHWLDAREYFRRLVDTFPQSPYRQDAKLGIGDSYLGENRVDSDILAANEFREFLTFFPLNARADYAQYKLALAQVRQMLAPQRDQTATHDALRELDTFVKNYPTSQLLPEVLKLQREAKDRLSESEFRIGLQYFRAKFYPGAIPRFKGIVETDPMYTHRDEVYYYLAESYYLSKQTAEAIPYYDRIVEEFAVSEYLEKAKTRLAELKH
ncbi:MAG TPA: outer membrane protein assembly factor BamD [Vicinamibacterales bacterium]|jgi:outer membrane protein assembly factor BamD|nr:outer membrane protein assembly factor BamD [Vicinamibacterales bacterium]